ncbi:MAG: IclR family transcriptional regulator [Acetobacteraceae bacterium]
MSVKDKRAGGEAAATPSRPGAPALEKGLDVLELLAAEGGGLTQKQVAERVGRSVSEIFRMLGVLEQRGYVARDRRTGEYTLTLRLFRLATQYPPTRRLQQAALPVMEALAAANNLSCHLSVISGPHFMVAAQVEPDWPMGWTVKLGAVFPLSMAYASARVLIAFQREGRREELAGTMARHDGIDLATVLSALARITRDGGDFGSNDLSPGVTSLSCPVLESSGRAVAALTVPLLREVGKAVDETAIAARLREAARRISATIGAAMDPPEPDGP